MCPGSKLSQVSAVTRTATRGAGEYLFINLDEFDHDLWPKNVVFCHWNDWTWIRGIIHLAFIDCMIIIFSLLNYSTYNWARLAPYLGEILRCRTFKKLFDIVWRVPQLTASKNEELFGDHDTVYLWKDWPLCPIRSSEEARENGTNEPSICSFPCEDCSSLISISLVQYYYRSFLINISWIPLILSHWPIEAFMR